MGPPATSPPPTGNFEVSEPGDSPASCREALVARIVGVDGVRHLDVGELQHTRASAALAPAARPAAARPAGMARVDFRRAEAARPARAGRSRAEAAERPAPARRTWASPADPHRRAASAVTASGPAATVSSSCPSHPSSPSSTWRPASRFAIPTFTVLDVSAGGIIPGRIEGGFPCDGMGLYGCPAVGRRRRPLPVCPPGDRCHATDLAIHHRSLGAPGYGAATAYEVTSGQLGCGINLPASQITLDLTPNPGSVPSDAGLPIDAQPPSAPL